MLHPAQETALITCIREPCIMEQSTAAKVLQIAKDSKGKYAFLNAVIDSNSTFSVEMVQRFLSSFS